MQYAAETQDRGIEREKERKEVERKKNAKELFHLFRSPNGIQTEQKKTKYKENEEKNWEKWC